jgi:hypothetical protein
MCAVQISMRRTGGIRERADSGDDGGVTQRPDYPIGTIKALSLRELVQRRPAMFFGEYGAVDWALVIAAWTASELLDYAVGPQPSVEVTLHQNGDLSAGVTGARLTGPATAHAAAVEEVIRHRMWWHQLARTTTVVVQRDGAPVGRPDVVGDELVWSDLNVVVRLALDADLIGVEPCLWWHDGAARLQAVLSTDRFRPSPGHTLTVIDELAGSTMRIA